MQVQAIAVVFNMCVSQTSPIWNLYPIHTKPKTYFEAVLWIAVWHCFFMLKLVKLMFATSNLAQWKQKSLSTSTLIKFSFSVYIAEFYSVKSGVT